ncbi:odorant receptor 131-2-like [Hippoglossus hippoglossus]|uniref:odorant receptor 131-2-like n=1 Tax=Hippoglossus hippoglossus TaxID=8267 RepID=UPI00148C2413|nr:odorant receptor 131-2-like [Hippoglossus hippoglossus]
MNSSSYNFNVTSYRDSQGTVVAKNVFLLALGLTINYINCTLIHTFRKHQILYLNPRYILFIHLVLNDMIQLTATISLFFFSYVFYEIQATLCCLIVSLAIFTTLNTPLNLAAMAVECYIAVCLPLRHAELCTIRRTYILIGWIWAMNIVSALSDVFIVLATQPLQLFHSTIFCERNNLFRHPVSVKKREVSYIIYLIGVWFTLLYAYFKIFLAAEAAKGSKSGDGDAKKATKTILLHGFQLLLCMLTYLAHVIRNALLNLFPKHFVHVLFVSYIIIQVLPRFISPMVYGLRDKTFRQHLKKHLICKLRSTITPW